MIVKSQIKLIRSLHQKKYRNENGLFFVEGKKAVQELLNSRFAVVKVYSTELGLLPASNEIVELITEAELKKISALNTPNKVLGIFKIPKIEQVNFDDWIVAVDDVRDPGNLGTIIRLCDWFGIKHLICSKETVDCYNPKTLQATMGSIARVNVGYTDLYDFLKTLEVPIYGAFMNGEVVYENKLPKSGVLVMGNEANGISEKIESLINQKISIPQFGMQATESLNVATATAILLNEIRRG
ncbi:TrmH family RNA methyltransferase [Flavobacteriaceae bacterium MAR_2009_75]|nr:TrmH family RNA methyltransferase [Flavobacteriaceae bacterium MAR_2009_75]